MCSLSKASFFVDRKLANLKCEGVVCHEATAIVLNAHPLKAAAFQRTVSKDVPACEVSPELKGVLTTRPFLADAPRVRVRRHLAKRVHRRDTAAMAVVGVESV